MSVQFGRWNIDGQPVDPGYMDNAKGLLAPYGPDGEGVYRKDGVGILYRAFHTTKESRQESQPLVTPSGSVLCWDGRLDNREELVRELGEPLTASATDLDIVAAAYEASGTGCFARLIGDWALSVWEPKTRSVVVAKDPIGTRHLYYSFAKDQITWSTILDPLVLLAGKSFELEEEYIAGWLSFFPATHLTPYVGIHAVPPSCFVRLAPKSTSVQKYWDFDPHKRIRYRTDGEYEEHFRQVFAESVRRRLCSDSPVLAELSGGVDSSSIVCMADQILARGTAETPRLDTVSYYDDFEASWNERPYFSKVEEQRGRAGCHINLGSLGTFEQDSETSHFEASPASRAGSTKAAKEFAACTVSGGYRVVLSGVGGDEVLGGVPTPLPELADLLAGAQLRVLARQLRAWALNKRKPWFRLLLETIRRFLPSAPLGTNESSIPWLDTSFAHRYRAALTGYQTRLRLGGPPPSFQESLGILDALRRQMACCMVPSNRHYVKEYPYLDRDFLEFLHMIPREQLVRPGQRRSLIRRALSEIVPQEVLNRKRKGFVARSAIAAALIGWANLLEVNPRLVSFSLGIIDQMALGAALQRARQGSEVQVVALIRACLIEGWLRQLVLSRIPCDSSAPSPYKFSLHPVGNCVWGAIDARRDSALLG